MNFDQITYMLHDSWLNFFESNKVQLNKTLSFYDSSFTPQMDNVFGIFKFSRINVKFVIIGQDPYPQAGHATGRSFEREIDDWRKANKSLQAILASIYFFENNEYKPIDQVLNEIDRGLFTVSKPRDIFKEWEAQHGVFFLNKSLTTEIGEKNAHVELWKPFTEELVKDLSKNHSIKWLLWGREAQELERFIENKDSVISTIHPAAFGYVDGDESEQRLNRFAKESGINLILNTETSIKDQESTQIKSEDDIDAKIHELQAELKRLKGLKDNASIQVFVDPEIESLKKKIELLENELELLENEKAETEKLIADFNYRFNIDLGDLILEILKLKKFIVQEDGVQYEEAKKKEEQFREHFNEEKKRDVKQLSEEESKLLKSLRNKAAKLCHPDKFEHESDDIKNRANEVSQELNEAYKNNDIDRVEQLLRILESGDLKPSERKGHKERALLGQKEGQLSFRIEDVRRELKEIKDSETYKKVEAIVDWDKNFNDLKSDLEIELERLKGEQKEADQSDNVQLQTTDTTQKDAKVNTSTSPKSTSRRAYSSSIQYIPCRECGAMHNANYNRCAVCNDFSASNDPDWGDEW
jgi:uracil DNA glycosylase